MARCLYHPDDCESERTVIISELEGGENDPEQLLEQEVTAAAFKAHPYGHPTIGWLADLQADDARGSVRLLPAVLRAEQRHARRGRRRGGRTTRSVASSGMFGPNPAGGAARAAPHRGAGAARPSARDHREAGHGRVLEDASVTRPSVDSPHFFPLVILDAVLTGAKGLNLWSSFRTPPPQRQRAAVPGARRSAARLVRRRCDAADRDPFLYRLSMTATAGTPLATLEDAAMAEIEPRRAARGSRTRSCRRRRTSSGRASFSRTTASPTSRTSSATSRRSRPGRCSAPCGSVSRRRRSSR